jgi:hypothetical protein
MNHWHRDGAFHEDKAERKPQLGIRQAQQLTGICSATFVASEVFPQ